MTLLRRTIPLLLLPLAIIACALASAPWLRAYPSAVLSVPLFGAALLSVLVPFIVVGIGVRRIWITTLIDLVIFTFYQLLVVLRQPVAFDQLWDGLVHGPSELLTYALPLISPRTLLVAPVTLCWLAGALLGECLARSWNSVLPYIGLLIAFGLAYAGSARAVTNPTDGHRYDTLLAAGLLLTMLLLRSVQAWVAQDDAAESTQPDGLLPFRNLWIGGVLSVVVALAAVGVAQTFTLGAQPRTPSRTPPVDRSRPFTPVSFIASLRPSDPRSKGQPLFSVTNDRATSNYISVASVDTYDGDGWSFDRTFRPSGGIVPADVNEALQPRTGEVTQRYRIAKGPMTDGSWMPYLYRPQNVAGVDIDVDPESGMIAPDRNLTAGKSYTVRSEVADTTFASLPSSAALASAEEGDLQLPQSGIVPSALDNLNSALVAETHTDQGQHLQFLQAVANDFRQNYKLAGSSSSAGGSSTGGSSTGESSTGAVTPHSSPGASARSSASPSATQGAPSQRAGSTTFADVLASIRVNRSATPEQYATLVCLLARRLGVPARLGTGFRIPNKDGSATLLPGIHHVSTADAYTWVEIPVSGLGWVVLDPSPQQVGGPTDQSSASAQPAPTQSSTPTQNGAITQAPSNGHAVAPPAKIPGSQHVSALAIVIMVLIGLVALVVLAALLQFGRRRLRARRRRRYGDPRRRLLGAWQESLDMLEEYGMPDLSGLTSREVSEQTGARFGGETGAQARFLGDAANVAIFSPTSWIGPAEADTAWRTHSVLTRSVRDRLSWTERVGSRMRYQGNRSRKRRVSRAFYASRDRRRARHSTQARGRRAR